MRKTSPSERAQRTYLRKAREIILAAEITRRYTKDQILELYLNDVLSNADRLKVPAGQGRGVSNVSER